LWLRNLGWQQSVPMSFLALPGQIAQGLNAPASFISWAFLEWHPVDSGTLRVADACLFFLAVLLQWLWVATYLDLKEERHPLFEKLSAWGSLLGAVLIVYKSLPTLSRVDSGVFARVSAGIQNWGFLQAVIAAELPYWLLTALWFLFLLALPILIWTRHYGRARAVSKL
jgi:hypothetical protein